MNPATNDAETKPLSKSPLAAAPEAPAAEAAEALVSQLLHDFKNQLGGLKLYAAVLKKSLANNTLDKSEGIALCDKIMQQIDELTARTKATARAIKPVTPEL
jgi:nitrogen-specific signal transduction histidine kinase